MKALFLFSATWKVREGPGEGMVWEMKEFFTQQNDGPETSVWLAERPYWFRWYLLIPVPVSTSEVSRSSG